MGLKNSFYTNFGLVAPDAYHKIKSVRGKNGGDIRFEIDIFYNKESCDDGYKPIESKVFLVPDSIKSKIGVIAELYEILKLTSEYSSAEDVFEADIEIDFDGYLLENSLCFSCQLEDGYEAFVGDLEILDSNIVGSFIYENYLVHGNLLNASISDAIWENNKIKKATVNSAIMSMVSIKQILL